MLGVQSVPAGLATGLLAGLNPVAGLYSYLFGVLGGAAATSSVAMAVQGTAAMAIVIADVDLASRADPVRALATLSVMTGAVMLIAGLLRLGSVLRFVSNSVMTGFIAAVGINIVIGQLESFTGYESAAPHRVVQGLDTLLHLGRVDVPTVLVGVATIAAILGLDRTRARSLSLVGAVAAGSVLAAILNARGSSVLLVGDVTELPDALPLPVAPSLTDVPALLVPAVSLAFVGLIQGAAVAAGFPNDDGRPADSSQDFVGQGVGNVVSGVFRGMPVGGSMSATSLVVSAGARGRAALLIAAVTMAVVVVAFGSTVGLVAMPALAGLLIVVGLRTIRPAQIRSVARTGPVPLTVMSVTLILTVLIPLQYAVLVGVGLSLVLFVAGQSARLTIKQIVFHADGDMEEVEPPRVLPPHEVVVLQPYGTVFFASAPLLLQQLPEVAPASTGSVVILRLRGVDEAGATFLEVVRQYARALAAAGSRLAIVTDNPRVVGQLRATDVISDLGETNVYTGTTFVGATLRRARADALEWVAANSGEEP